MTNTQIKDYLKKYRIDSEESLAKHIEELKRNTIPNNEIIFPLVDLLLNEKSVLLSFFRENSKERGETVTKTTTPFFLDEAVISYQSFENGITKDNTVTYTSTRHKSQAGETHKEIVGDLEGVNKPKGVEVSLKELKENTINNVELGLDIADILGITLCDNRDYIYKLIEKKISAKKDKIKTAKLHTYPLTPEECFKDDVITNSSRGEKETMEYLQGVKESQSVDKAPIFTYCKVNKNALEALSLRALYGHIKYKETDSDWQNFTRVPNALEEYANASFRHALGIGEEDEETHLVAEAWNAVAKLEVFLRNKLNKS